MNELTLTNRALRDAKLDTIDSLDDTDKVSAYCRENLQEFIDEVLSEHPWGFARKQQALNQLTVGYGEWDFTFDMPDDMINFQGLFPTGQDWKQYSLLTDQYEIFNDESSSDGAYGRVASHEEYLSLVYTKRITTVAFLPQYFTLALEYLMAFNLATTFGGAERAAWAYAMYFNTRLPWAVEKDNERRRPNVKGTATLLTEDFVQDPWNRSI